VYQDSHGCAEHGCYNSADLVPLLAQLVPLRKHWWGRAATAV